MRALNSSAARSFYGAVTAQDPQAKKFPGAAAYATALNP
jgi:hypothetical protein